MGMTAMEWQAMLELNGMGPVHEAAERMESAMPNRVVNGLRMDEPVDDEPVVIVLNADGKRSCPQRATKTKPGPKPASPEVIAARAAREKANQAEWQRGYREAKRVARLNAEAAHG